MSLIFKVPTHLDGHNPIMGRYTARELVPVVVGIFSAAGVLGQSHLPPSIRIGEALTLAILGGTFGLVRPRGRSLAVWGRCAAAHLLGARASVWAPPSALVTPTASINAPSSDALRPPHLVHVVGASTTAPAGQPCMPASSSSVAPRLLRRPATSTHSFVPVEIVANTIVFSDGRACAILECSGVTIEGMDVAQQRAVHTAYHSFLLGLAFPVQILICADPADTDRYAVQRMERLSGRPVAVRRLGSADTAFMRRALSQLNALDQHVYLVIPDAAGSIPSLEGTEPLISRRLQRHLTATGQARNGMTLRDGAAVSRLLDERCTAVRESLARIGVHAWRLDTPALQALYYRRLCPRTARVQPFDQGHTAPVVDSDVLFGQVCVGDHNASDECDDATTVA